MTDLTYYSIIGLARTWFKAMDFQWRITGSEHIPAEGGAVLAINHVSYVDFIMAGYGAVPSGRHAIPTYVAAAAPTSTWPCAPMLNRPERKPTARPRPAKMSGTDAVMVSVIGRTRRRPVAW